MKTMLTILFMSVICGNPVTAQTAGVTVTDIACDTLKTENDDSKAKADACRRIFIDRGMVRRDTTVRRIIDRKAFTLKRYDSFREKMKEPWLGGLLKDILFR